MPPYPPPAAVPPVLAVDENQSLPPPPLSCCGLVVCATDDGAIAPLPAAEEETAPPPGRRPGGGGGTRHMMVRSAEAYIFAPRDGLFEPLHRAGAAVEAGQPAGYLHNPEDLGTAPVPLHYASGGVLWMAAGPGRARRGDAVAVVMEDYADDW